MQSGKRSMDSQSNPTFRDWKEEKDPGKDTEKEYSTRQEETRE